MHQLTIIALRNTFRLSRFAESNALLVLLLLDAEYSYLFLADPLEDCNLLGNRFFCVERYGNIKKSH